MSMESFRSIAKRQDGEAGSVLIIVMWVCLGLVSMTLLFGQSMLMAHRGADNDLAGRQADQAIEGAARYAESILAAIDTPGLFPNATTYQSEAVPVGEATFWFLGRPDDPEANQGRGAARTYRLVDEASKLNLNTATQDMLAALPGMTPDLAAAIIDWRDDNDDVTPGGAESTTYLAMHPGYACKNAPFESTEELALVVGFDQTLLYGEDANGNGALDANEDDSEKSLPADNADGRLDPGVLEYVTVWSREPNTRADGSARVNVSTITPEVVALLTDQLGASRTQAILGQLGRDFRCRSVLEFNLRAGLTADETTKLSDAITTKPGDFVSGLVNVNTASETVLACIPGIGTDKASTLVASRSSRAQQDTSLAWVVEALGEPNALLAGPYVTGKSYQVSADVAAVGRHRRGYRRTRFVIDNSTGTPRIIYRRNLAALGWALDPAARDEASSTGRITP